MKTGLKDLDKFAYHVVCNWPEAIGFNPVHKGIDYSYIIRFYLWDKVGRALRIKHGIDFGEVAVYKKEYQSFLQYYTPLIAKGTYKKKWFSKAKVVFIPYQAPHTKHLIEKLLERKDVKVISKVASNALTKKNLIKPQLYTTDEVWSGKLYKHLMEALIVCDIKLIDEDVWLLKQQIEGAVKLTNLAEEELKTNKPDAVYVHSDNHPPFINYVLTAKKIGIPVFAYQHGLDCEHYYLDDCFADYVAVWSEYRKDKYKLKSVTQPKSYKVIGNFLLQDLEQKGATVSNELLFITRPHRPIKCYSPSRSFEEGKNILESVLEFMKRDSSLKLIIKPHPMDLVDAYQESIEKYKMEDRVEISFDALPNLLLKAKIVITEDSTAGVEAMYFKLPIIHAHFAKTCPVLPLVENNAAYKGFNKEELQKSLERSLSLNIKEKALLNQNQQVLLEKLMPLGQVKSMVNYILENI